MTKREQNAWVQIQKDRFEKCKSIIMTLCDLSDYEYFWLVVNVGVHYIHKTSGKYEQFEQEVVYTPGHFWPWFTNQWNMANEEFIMHYELDKVSEPIAQATSKAILRHYLVFQKEHLSSEPMEKGYEFTISQLIKTSVKNAKRPKSTISSH